LHVQATLTALEQALDLLAIVLGQLESEETGGQAVVTRIGERALEQLRILLSIGIR